MLKKLCLATVILLMGLLLLTSCDEAEGAADAPDTNLTAAETPPATPETTPPPEHEHVCDDDCDHHHLPLLDGTMLELLRDNPMVLRQFQPVEPGEELVTLHTNHGDITLRFFPEDAPIAVENFLTHARNGFYDGVTFHRVIPGFMIQGGCPLGTGGGGESIWGHDFGLEPSFNLRHFRGALAMAHAGGRMGSQFYIVQSTSIDMGTRMEFEMIMQELDTPIGVFSDGHRIYGRDIHSIEELEYFIENGGTPFLDWYWNQNAHTVFGHVVEGMDVVDAIANVSRGANDRPDEPVIIERISFFYYG